MADIAEVNPSLKDEKVKMWNLIRECFALDWLMLTKRPSNLVRELPMDWGDGWPHVWLGTTVEDNHYRKRIDAILKAPAEVHFLSVEPHIGPLNLEGYLTPEHSRHRIDWVILGGESGAAGARKYDLGWAREVIACCRANNVACFVKQLGKVAAQELGLLDTRKGADLTEWPTDLRVREFPKGRDINPLLARRAMPVTAI